jgi:hypothetical protein
MAHRFWLAREKASYAAPTGLHPYVLANLNAPPERKALGEDVFYEPLPQQGHLLNAELWHAAGGLRLRPGAAPLLVDVTLVVAVVVHEEEVVRGG